MVFFFSSMDSHNQFAHNIIINYLLYLTDYTVLITVKASKIKMSRTVCRHHQLA